MKEPNAVGKRLPRLEAVQKVTGRAMYTEDLSLPSMVFGCVIRSPHSHALVRAIHTEEAKKVPGFVGVLLPDEVPDTLYNCSGNPPSPLLMPDERILTNHPLCAGDRIMAVAAEDMMTLREVVSKISIEYQLLPAVFTIKDAVKGGAVPIQPGLSSGNIINVRDVVQGDVEVGFQEADYLFEDDFHTSAMQHAAMELTGCICDFSDGIHLNIWSNSQTPYQERRIMAGLFGMSEADIRIVKPVMGGGFGARQQLHSQPVGALLSKKIRRPVKIINTREEDMYASVTRHEMQTHLKFGLKADGTLLAFQTEFYLNGGPYTTHTPTIAAAAGRKFQYGLPHYRFTGYSVTTNAATAGAFRGYGNAQLTFGRELMMSRIARSLHLDPVEFRLKNHIRAGEKFPAATAAVTSCEIEKCARRCIGIREEIDRREGLVDDVTVRQAWGVAFSCHGSGPSSKEGMSSAVIMTNDDGSVRLMVGSADIGQGSETILCQLAADQLGIPLSLIRITAADTGVTPYDTGTFGSSQTFVSGNAVTRACEDLKEKVRAALSHYYENGEVTIRDKKFLVAGGNKEFTFPQAVRQVIFGLRGSVLIGSACYKAQESPNPFAVCMAKAEFEKKTGAIRLLHVIEVADVGTPINPLSVEGQLEGGIAQGIGYALTERLEHNAAAKKTCSSDLLLYRIPLMGDMPAIHTEIVESYEPAGPVGAKSVGELATVPVAPAIVDAVCEASGQIINRIPLSDVFMIKPPLRQNGEK